MATLAGQSVPSPSSYDVTHGHRGSAFVMADGSLKTDVVNASAKKVIAVGWTAVSSSQLSAIITGFNALATATGTWQDHHSTSYTVTQDEGLAPLKYRERPTANGVVYDVNISLREV